MAMLLLIIIISAISTMIKVIVIKPPTGIVVVRTRVRKANGRMSKVVVHLRYEPATAVLGQRDLRRRWVIRRVESVCGSP